MGEYTPTEQFVRRLTEYQSRLYAYILAILGDPGPVGDILQDTNVAIWRKAAEFEAEKGTGPICRNGPEGASHKLDLSPFPPKFPEGTDFWAWTSRIAHYEVLAYRKRRRRDRLVFDEALLEDIAIEAAQQAGPMEADLAALVRCMERLSQLDQELVRGRYTPGGSVRQLAQLRGKSAGAVSQALYRIRAELADCVEKTRQDDEGEKGGGHD